MSAHAFADCYETSLWDMPHDEVRRIVKEQFDVNQPDSLGSFLLSAACGRLQVENVQLFLSRGANPNCHDAVGGTPLLCAIDVAHWNPPAACEIADALLKAGADVEGAYLGKTPFLKACCRGSVDLLKVLVLHGANPHAKDVDIGGSCSALYFAELFKAPPEMIAYIHSLGVVYE